MESALIAVISQRLVRKICPLCGEPYHLSQKELEALHLSEEELAGLPIRKGFGCSQCRGTGYLGRTAVFEIMPITDELRTLIHNNAAAHIIRSVAIKEGMQTLLASAIAKLKDGVTTSKEVLRIIGGVL
jgi:type IV pilus assembly protein PilB